MDIFIPFCGAAPIPGSEIWRLAPGLVASLLAVFIGYLLVFSQNQPFRKVAFFSAGWAILSLALVSPLCNLSVALFSARVTQHMILMLLAAPLIAAGLPSGPQKNEAGFLLGASAALFAALWFWHSPAPYDGTLHDNFIYWTMQTSLIGASVAFWLALLGAESFAAFFAATATGLHMSLLGAIFAFAKAPLFHVYAHTTGPWGLTQIQDQNLGGLIMWVPAGLALTAYSVIALGLALHRMSTAQAGSRYACDIGRL